MNVFMKPSEFHLTAQQMLPFCPSAFVALRDKTSKRSDCIFEFDEHFHCHGSDTKVSGTADRHYLEVTKKIAVAVVGIIMPKQVSLTNVEHLAPSMNWQKNFHTGRVGFDLYFAHDFVMSGHSSHVNLFGAARTAAQWSHVTIVSETAAPLTKLRVCVSPN